METKGNSYQFVGKRYKNSSEKLQIGDEVIIHPTKRSQATKSYPAKIAKSDSFPNELCLMGIRENSHWHGAILNDYGFDRLEFVRRI